MTQTYRCAQSLVVFGQRSVHHAETSEKLQTFVPHPEICIRQVLREERETHRRVLLLWQKVLQV